MGAILWTQVCEKQIVDNKREVDIDNVTRMPINERGTIGLQIPALPIQKIISYRYF